jgi:hypothetical protein
LEALRVAVHQPDAVADCLHEALFESPVARRAFTALASAQTLREAIDSAAEDEEVTDLLQRLAVEEETAEDPIDPVARLAEQAASRALTSLDSESSALVPWLKTAIEETRDQATARDATERLVRWLAERLREET